MEVVIKLKENLRVMSSSLSRDELVELVRKIMNFEGTEKEIDESMDILEKNVADPQVTGYIFWPSRYTSPPRELSAEEVVDRALSYQPIILPPGK